MKMTLLRIINPLLLLLLLFQFVSALFRTDYYQFFSRWHPIGGYALVALGLLHLVLNWKWINAAYRKR
ncbi:DUF4405 domain-containing protein [Candidatus Fermentibacteria bacterium]|nr:DUF4405 domain-containing protein [Candidatus Fermentibacteria bacterium]